MLHSIYESFSRKRAIGSISVLVYGTSGVGKSSTVNFLFDLKEGDINAAKTNENTSQTRSVTELIIQTTEDEYETRDIRVAIVDSPGLNDTHGHAQDACNAFAIRKFYEDYALKAEAGKIYPNLIFVVIAASDRRIDGPTSNLIKSLRVLGKLDLVDTAKPNVVGIITHACQFARSKTRWIERFEEKKEKLQSIILEYLHVEAPVVALENYPEQEELDPEGYGYLLPDGVTQQPRNLFTACSNLLWENGDLFGHLAFTSAFKGGQSIPLLGRVLPAKIANLAPLDDSEKQLFRFIQRCAEGEIAGDPLLYLANKFISEQTEISGAEKSRLLRLAANLKRNGIQDPEELSELTTNSVYLTTTVMNSPAVESFLIQWGVEPTDPLTLDESVILIGHGFNLLMDKATAPSLFQYELRNTKMGIIVPGPSRFSRSNQTVTFMHNFENEVELMKTRQRHLNVSLEVNQLLLEGLNTRAGFSLNKQRGNSESNTEYSFLLEQRMFRVSFPSVRRLSLTEEFKSAANELPDAFEPTNADNRNNYKKFFDKWGHFVVTQAFGGGSVELKINCSSSSSVEFEEMKLKLLASFNAGFMSPTASAGYEQSLSSESRAILGRCRMEWNGGDSQFHRHETMTDPQVMNKWRLSLAKNPAMLTTDLSLAPISDIVENVNGAKGKECYMALEDFLGGKFNLRKEEEDRQRLKSKMPKTRKDQVEEDRKGRNSKCLIL